MDTKREPNARRHPISAERALHRLRRHAIASALVVGGAALAAADVSVGIGWGLVLAGAALAVQPYSGPPREGSPQDSGTPGRRAAGDSRRRLRRPSRSVASSRMHRTWPAGRLAGRFELRRD
jgi:hypothetical protein